MVEEITPVTTITKVTLKKKKKKNYKFKELELVSAWKHVSTSKKFIYKGKSNITYDSNMVFGGRSSAEVTNAKNDKIVSKETQLEMKIVERDSEYHTEEEHKYHEMDKKGIYLPEDDQHNINEYYKNRKKPRNYRDDEYSEMKNNEKLKNDDKGRSLQDNNDENYVKGFGGGKRNHRNDEDREIERQKKYRLGNNYQDNDEFYSHENKIRNYGNQREDLKIERKNNDRERNQRDDEYWDIDKKNLERQKKNKLRNIYQDNNEFYTREDKISTNQREDFEIHQRNLENYNPNFESITQPNYDEPSCDLKSKPIFKQHDINSCNYCEEVYRIIIFQNLPVKVFDCYYCHNMINSSSLNFYYKKYEMELKSLKEKQLPKVKKSVEINKSLSNNILISDFSTPKNRNEFKFESPVENNLISDKEINIKTIKFNEKITTDSKNNDIQLIDLIKDNIPNNKNKINITEKDFNKDDKNKTAIEKLKEDTIISEKILVKPPLTKKNLNSTEKVSVQSKPEKVANSGDNYLNENQKPVNFSKEWVDWNTATNAEKLENNKKMKELIEINVSENNELKGNSLAEAFKKKKKDLVKKFERQEKISCNNNISINNENTVIDDKKNSKNITKNDIIDETNCTKSDLKNENTTIGEILNDSELKPSFISSPNKSKLQKKSKLKEYKVIPEENEPSKELIDRLIYGKKAEVRIKV